VFPDEAKRVGLRPTALLHRASLPVGRDNHKYFLCHAALAQQ